MNENRNFDPDMLTKWLRVLMYIAVVSLINAAANFVPFIPAALTTWISRGVTIAMVICMFQLAPVNARYRKAGILRAVMLICTLITAFVHASSILTFTASILSIVAVYQEYNAHSELVSDQDAKLAGKWHSLFNWSILAGVLVGFGSVLGALIVAAFEMDVVRVTALVIGLLGIPLMILDFVYILYIRKMIAIFENSEVR